MKHNAYVYLHGKVAAKLAITEHENGMCDNGESKCDFLVNGWCVLMKRTLDRDDDGSHLKAESCVFAIRVRECKCDEYTKKNEEEQKRSNRNWRERLKKQLEDERREEKKRKIAMCYFNSNFKYNSKRCFNEKTDGGKFCVEHQRFEELNDTQIALKIRQELYEHRRRRRAMCTVVTLNGPCLGYARKGENFCSVHSPSSPSAIKYGTARA